MAELTSSKIPYAAMVCSCEASTLFFHEETLRTASVPPSCPECEGELMPDLSKDVAWNLGDSLSGIEFFIRDGNVWAWRYKSDD